MTTKDDGARSACPTGPAAYLGGDHPEPVNNPDTALIALELEHDELEASIKGLSEEETDKRASRVGEIAREIFERPASNLHGAAAKLRVLRYHAGQMKHTGDVLCLDTCLDALDHVGDVQLIFMEQEHNRRYFETKFPEDSKEANENTDRIAVLAREIAGRLAHTVTGATVKLRVMRAYLRHSECDWYEESLDTALAALAAAPEPAVIPAAATGNPDAKLSTLEIKMRAAHEGLAAVPSDDDDVRQPWIDRMITVEEAAQAIPAQTAMGVLAKVRMAAWYVKAEPAATDDADEIWLRNIAADAQRIGATVPADPDTELQDLWSQHQALCGAWPADATDEESDRHGNRINQVELQIAATPANSLAGIAIKLQVAAIDVVSADDLPCARNVVSARDDAMRLTGLGGAL